MKRVFFFLIFLTPLAQSCRSSSPSEALDKETFAAVYVALAEDGAAFRSTQPEGGKSFDPEPTLSRYGVTKEQYELTIRLYRKNMEWWKEFYTEAISLYDKKTKKPAVPNRSVLPAPEGASQAKPQ